MRLLSLSRASLLVGLLGVGAFADMPYQVMQQKITELEKRAENANKNIEQLSKNDQVLEDRVKNAEKKVAELEQFKAHATEMLETVRKISQSNAEYFKKLHDEQRAIKKEIAKNGASQKSQKADGELSKKVDEQGAKIAEMNKDIDALFSKLLEMKGSMQKAGNTSELEGKITATDEKVGTINKDVDVLFSKLLEMKSALDKMKKEQQEKSVQAFEQKEKQESKPEPKAAPEAPKAESAEAPKAEAPKAEAPNGEPSTAPVK